MQVVTVPKEVIWATRLLWVWLIVNIAVNFILSGIYEVGAIFIYLIFALPLGVFILSINYFLKKANKWLMWIFLVSLILVVLLDIYKLLAISQLTEEEIKSVPSYIIRILFGVPIIYLLLNQKSFFSKKNDLYEDKK